MPGSDVIKGQAQMPAGISLVFLPIALFLALLVVGARVASESLTAYGSPANVFAEMLAVVSELLFLAYLVLLGIGFGIAKIVTVALRMLAPRSRRGGGSASPS